jgi:sodium/proline symporter
MPIADSPIIAFCVIAYLVACLGVGLWAMRRTKTAADFFVAGRSLGLFVTVIAGVSSIMSGFGFVGGPGLVYESGISSLHMCLVGGFSGAWAWVIIGKRMRLLSEVATIYTLPEAIEIRYGGRAPRLVMAIAVLLGVIGYLGTQVMAIGLVLQAVLGVSLPVAMLIGLGVLAFYSIAGGIIAGVYTDLFQGVLMIIAALGIFYYVHQLTGGLSEITQTLWDVDADYMSPWGTRGAIAALSWYFLFVVGNVGQPHGVLTKSLMMRNIRDLKWAPLLAFAAAAFLPLLWMNIGLAMRYLVETGAQEPLANPDLAAPLFLLNHTPEWLAGMVFAALLAAIMSTADSFVNLGAAAIVRDIPAAIYGKPPEKQLKGSRLVSGGLLLVSAVFALYMDNLVALLGTFGWGTFAAAIVPSAAIGFNWKRATAAACVSSVSLSVVLNFSLELLARHGIYKLPHGMAVGALSLFVSLVVFVVVSFLTGDKEGSPIPPHVKAVMEA